MLAYVGKLHIVCADGTDNMSFANMSGGMS